MNTKPPEISIIVPVYNVAKWLNKCLDSIKAQSFTEWECILVDDGSQDMSGIICDSYARSDARFSVIHQVNAGVSAARNAGIKAAKGLLLSFIDPDDYISENYFESLLNRLKETKSDFSFCVVGFVIEEEGRIIPPEAGLIISKLLHDCWNDTIRGNEEVIKELCNNRFSCVCWGKLYKRELWGDALFPVGIDLGEDMMTVPRVMIKAQAAALANEAVYYYRIREKSLLHGTVTRERYEKDLEASEIMQKQLTEYAPQYAESFRLLKLTYDVGCYRSFVKSNPELRKTSSILYGIYKSGLCEEFKSFGEH